MGMRQDLHADLIRRVLDHVIDQAIRVGRLQGGARIDPVTGHLSYALAGDQDRGIDIDFPDLSTTPLKELIEAIVAADGTELLPPRAIAYALLLALPGIEDVDASHGRADRRAGRLPVAAGAAIRGIRRRPAGTRAARPAGRRHSGLMAVTHRTLAILDQIRLDLDRRISTEDRLIVEAWAARVGRASPRMVGRDRPPDPDPAAGPQTDPARGLRGSPRDQGHSRHPGRHHRTSARAGHPHQCDPAGPDQGGQATRSRDAGLNAAAQHPAGARASRRHL
jgi:hypothetical protein